MAILDTVHKKKSVIITSVILIVLFWMVFNVGMQYLDPPAEYGIAINYGTTNLGTEKPKVTQVNKIPVEQATDENLENVEKQVLKETNNEEVIDQSDIDSSVLEQSKNEEKKETPKKPSKNTLKAFDDLLKGKTSDGKQITQGDEDGVEEDKKGDPIPKKYYSNKGTDDDSNYKLGNRRAIDKPKEQPNCQEEGTVVVSIEVDKYGRVISAKSGIKGTTNSAICLQKPAKAAALKTTWEPDLNATGNQTGTITYTFSLIK